jgi:hypothetical protein
MGDGLRQRKQSDHEGKGSEETVKSYLQAIEHTVPQSIKPYLEKVAPYVISFTYFVEAYVIPFLHKLYDLYCYFVKISEPYHLDLLLPGFVGLVMCFFGGSYMTLIAAVEAYRMVGYQSQLKFVQNLKDDFTKFLAANKEDDKVDADHDGVADVLQISGQQLATRKTLLFLKTVDPNKIGEAFSGLQSGLLAVVATLKMEFAKSITLGSAIADIVLKPANRYVTPMLENILPADYKKWAKPSVVYSIKSIAISLAWFVQRVISAYHSAIRGGHMFAGNLFEYLDKQGIIHIDVNNSYLDEIIGYGMALLGLWFQLSSGFTLFFPLNVILFPFTLLEWSFMWLVNSN